MPKKINYKYNYYFLVRKIKNKNQKIPQKNPQKKLAIGGKNEYTIPVRARWQPRTTMGKISPSGLFIYANKMPTLLFPPKA